MCIVKQPPFSGPRARASGPPPKQRPDGGVARPLCSRASGPPPNQGQTAVLASRFRSTHVILIAHRTMITLPCIFYPSAPRLSDHNPLQIINPLPPTSSSTRVAAAAASASFVSLRHLQHRRKQIITPSADIIINPQRQRCRHCRCLCFLRFAPPSPSRSRSSLFWRVFDCLLWDFFCCCTKLGLPQWWHYATLNGINSVDLQAGCARLICVGCKSYG